MLRKVLGKAVSIFQSQIWKLSDDSILTGEYRTDIGTNRDYRRFILFGYQRSGSSMIIYGVGTHPNVVTYGELFNPSKIGSANDPFRQKGRKLIFWRNRKPRKFLEEQVFSGYKDQIEAVGFKIFPDQLAAPGLEAVWDWLEKNQDIAILFLVRRNHLATLASTLIAKKTGQYNIKSREERSEVKLKIGYNECLSWFESLNASIEATRQRLANHPIFDVVYEDYLKDYEGSFCKLQTYLGINPTPLKSPFIKKEKRPLNEVIENYDELKEQFSGSKWAYIFELE